MVYFKYIILSTLHKDDMKDDDGDDYDKSDLSSQRSYMIQLLTHTTTQ
jgi:hypothetical protein